MDEAALADWTAAFVSGKWGKLLDGRFFQGTIAAVAPNPNGFGFLLTIRRTNEATVDPNQYLSINPAYFPAVGDVVECCWRDSNVGLVFGPIQVAKPTSLIRARAHSVGQSIPDNVGGGTVVTLATAQVDYDPNGNFANNTFTCPIAGYYAVSWAIRLAPGLAGRLQARLRVNGTDEETMEVRFAAGDFPTAAGSDRRKCKAGDTFALSAYQLSGGAQPIQVDPGYGSTFLAVELLAPA